MLSKLMRSKLMQSEIFRVFLLCSWLPLIMGGFIINYNFNLGVSDYAFVAVLAVAMSLGVFAHICAFESLFHEDEG